MSRGLARVAAALRDVDLAERRLRAAVDEAKAEGATWSQVGRVCGVSRQAAWERFSRTGAHPTEPATSLELRSGDPTRFAGFEVLEDPDMPADQFELRDRDGRTLGVFRLGADGKSDG